MNGNGFRFLHASDFHLETVVAGLAEVPDQLRATVLDAAYRAVGHLFDVALAESVDFVLLCGDLLHIPSTGPRGPLFLLDQFARLATRNIPVYWLTAGVDEAEGWPSGMKLDAHVHRLSPQHAAEFVFERAGAPVARIAVATRAAEMSRGESNPIIAMAHGALPAWAGQATSVDYWALGGRHERSTPSEAPAMVHYPGTPQGRSPDEWGPRGATIVDWRDGRPKLRFVPTDVLRWHSESIDLEPGLRRGELDVLLRRRIQELLLAQHQPQWLVSWRMHGTGPLARQLRRGELAAELLAGLQSEFGHSKPSVWSTSLDVNAAFPLPGDLAQQDSLLGDFLRELEMLRSGKEGDPLEAWADRAAALAPWLESASTDDALATAALLGIDLLGPEEATR